MAEMVNEQTEVRYARGPDGGCLKEPLKPLTKVKRLLFLNDQSSLTVPAGTLCASAAAFEMAAVIRAFLSGSSLIDQADPARAVPNRVRNLKLWRRWRGIITTEGVPETICPGIGLQAIDGREDTCRGWTRRTSALPRAKRAGRMRRGCGVDVRLNF
ncbi:hypothetical protein JW859_02940 [bacterium]|nr:hypothetical protein [bacterium]